MLYDLKDESSLRANSFSSNENNQGFKRPAVDTLVSPSHGSMKLFLVSLVLILGLAWINRRAIVGAILKRSGAKRSRGRGYNSDGASTVLFYKMIILCQK